MSPRFQPSDIDEVRQRADIVEVVGEHVRLRKAGRTYKGLCPFHQERTPSFTVDREKGVWFCHGCHAGGSVFTFLEQIENLTFVETVETLARRYGVEMREVTGQTKRESPRARLIAVHEAAVDLYRQALRGPRAAPVREYLDERGIDQKARDTYYIGFGGWPRDGLVRTMTRRGYTAEELLAAGLATRDGRALRDTFHGRLLFPIFDPSGKPIGFGGRVIPDAYRQAAGVGGPDGPKYLNSRETAIFHKSRVLYGTNWARGDVVRTKRLVLVEGYTDVIALHGAGVGEAVATCGTSLTEQHMQEISRRFGDVRVLLCLDADAAGQAAMSADRTQELAGAYAPGEEVQGGKWLPVGKGWLPEVWVATLPAGQDPADFVRSGSGRLSEVLDDAAPLVEFLLRRALASEGKATPEERTRAIRRGAAIVAQMGDPLLRHEYALWLSDRVGVDAYEVARAVEDRVGKSTGARRDSRKPSPDAPGLSGHQRVEREALRALVSVPQHLDSGHPEVTEDDFTLPVHRALFRLVRAEWEEREGVDPGRLADRVQDESLRRAVSELALGDLPDAIAGREMLVRLKEFSLGREIESCKTRLRQLDPDREASAYDALFERLLELEKERRALAASA